MSATDPARRPGPKRRRAFAVAGLAVAVAAVAATLVAAPAAASDPLPAGTYTLSFTDAAASDAAIDELGIVPIRRYDSVITGFTAKLTSDQATSVAAAPGNVGLLADRTVTALAQTVPPAVRAVEADKAPVNAGSGAAWTGPNAAVLDSGVSTHPDLNLKSAVNCFTTGTGADVDGHGTGVSGVLGAIDNASGILGVAPGVPIYSVRVLDGGLRGTVQTLMCGLEWVSENADRYDLKVVNMSISYPGADDGNCGYSNADTIHQAICSLTGDGISVVARRGQLLEGPRGVLPRELRRGARRHEHGRLRRQARRARLAPLQRHDEGRRLRGVDELRRERRRPGAHDRRARRLPVHDEEGQPVRLRRDRHQHGDRRGERCRARLLRRRRLRGQVAGAGDRDRARAGPGRGRARARLHRRPD